MSSILSRPHHHPVAALGLRDQPAELELGEACGKPTGLESGRACELVGTAGAVGEALEHLRCSLAKLGRAGGWEGNSPNSSSTSSAEVNGVAPWRISRFVPVESMLVISPGTANTSRPSSSAMSAVISAPLRSRASTITVAAVSPAMIRLRAGNLQGAGSTPDWYSETTRPR